MTDGCTRDVYAKKDSGLARYESIQDTVYMYGCGVNNGILELDRFAPIEKQQATATFQRLVKKKKISYLGKFEDHAYHLFQAQACKRAWTMFNERHTTTQLTSPQVWHEYAKVLYDILRQPPFPHPHGSCLHESNFFTPQNVRNAIDWLQFGKAKNNMDQSHNISW